MLTTNVSYIIPFHSDIQRVFETVRELRRNKSRFDIKEVLLCHNGPPLALNQREEIAALLSPDFEKLLHTDHEGIGAGYRMGIENATGDFLVLSASDLPFGFTDIEAFVIEQGRADAPIEMAIGSKAHPESEVKGHGLVRRAVSVGFYYLRRICLGSLTPGDSQGTILGRRGVLLALAKDAPSHDYLFSLELATAYCVRHRKPILELPVRLEHHGGMSSVSVLKDGVKLFRGVLKLRAGLPSQR
jgi:dolichyl-phosphate beta-glucosyltransferase